MEKGSICLLPRSGWFKYIQGPWMSQMHVYVLSFTQKSRASLVSCATSLSATTSLFCRSMCSHGDGEIQCACAMCICKTWQGYFSGFWLFSVFRVHFIRDSVCWRQLRSSEQILTSKAIKCVRLPSGNKVTFPFCMQSVNLGQSKQFDQLGMPRNISHCCQTCKPNKPWKRNFIIRFMVSWNASSDVRRTFCDFSFLKCIYWSVSMGVQWKKIPR